MSAPLPQLVCHAAELQSQYEMSPQLDLSGSGNSLRMTPFIQLPILYAFFFFLISCQTSPILPSKWSLVTDTSIFYLALDLISSSDILLQFSLLLYITVICSQHIHVPLEGEMTHEGEGRIFLSYTGMI